MLGRLAARRRRRTVAAHKAYDTTAPSPGPPAASRPRRAEHRRPARRHRRAHHPPEGHAASMRARKRIEEPFGLDQDHRRLTETPLPRPPTQPSLFSSPAPSTSSAPPTSTSNQPDDPTMPLGDRLGGAEDRRHPSNCASGRSPGMQRTDAQPPRPRASGGGQGRPPGRRRRGDGAARPTAIGRLSAATPAQPNTSRRLSATCEVFPDGAYGVQPEFHVDAVEMFSCTAFCEAFRGVLVRHQRGRGGSEDRAVA